MISAVHVRSDGHNLLLWENCVKVDSMKSVSDVQGHFGQNNLIIINHVSYNNDNNNNLRYM
jgi:hypothetical protein